MDNHFGVAPGSEAMSTVLKLVAEFKKIVDFPVVDDPCTAVFVEYRLVAARKVNNAEAAHSQARAILHPDAFVIWSTVDDAVAHFAHQVFANVGFPAGGDNSGNSTHLPVAILLGSPKPARFLFLGSPTL